MMKSRDEQLRERTDSPEAESFNLTKIYRSDERAIVAGLRFLSKLGLKSIHSGDDQALLEAHREFAEFFAWQTYRTFYRKKRTFRRAAFTAAMYATWVAAPEKAFEFWSDVASSLFHRGVPCDFLQLFFEANGPLYRTVGRNSKRLTRRDVFCQCLHAFQCFVTGDRYQKNYSESGEIPQLDSVTTGKEVGDDQAA